MTFKPFKLDPPTEGERVLLHSCCAPCTGVVMDLLLYSEINFTLFFYNPNIHPKKEYELRKEHTVGYARKRGVPFVDAGYEPREWLDQLKGLAGEPERGERCTKCFDIRLELTALYAKNNGFKVFTTSCGISPWKDMDQVLNCGRAAARRHGVAYWDYNWRKGGGAQGMYDVAKREGFYKQEYCGCIFSLMAENARRREKGLPAVELGKNFYKN